jgi:hypothetical protein
MLAKSPKPASRIPLAWLCCLLLLMTLSACKKDRLTDSRAPNDAVEIFRSRSAAVWALDPTQKISSSSDSFTALVNGMECSSGIKGKVFDPVIELGKERIVVTFLVAAPPKLGKNEFHTCQGTEGVPYEVKLHEQIANRQLIDGSCRQKPAAGTGHCYPGAARWLP